VRLADNYLRRLILREIVDEKTIHIKKFEKWKAIVERRSPFSKMPTRFPGKQAPLMVHPVSDFGAAMELTIWIVWKRTQKIIPCILPKSDLGYHDLRDRPLPDRTKKYQRRLPVPGDLLILGKYDEGAFTRLFYV